MHFRFGRRVLLASTGLSAASLLVPGARREQHWFGFEQAQATIKSPALAKFRQSLKGRVILPGEGEYDSARRVASFNPSADKRPQMIVRCAQPEDVARAVTFAREQSLEVAVRAGGHDLLGASVCEGGMVIDVSPMKGIDLDPGARRARAQAGVRSGELNAATQPLGLAAALGCHPGVGITGLTLGGGLGWLLGRYGASCDNLIGADVVTADGRMVRASATENSDLFWALRGGGGNFGIATALEYDLHAVDRVLAGVAVYRVSDLAAFLLFYGDFMKAAPDELAVEMKIFGSEQPTIWAFACWSGEISAGQHALRALRSFAPTIADTIQVVPYARLLDQLPPAERASHSQPDSGTPRREARRDGPGFNFWRGGSLLAITREAAHQIASATQRAPKGWSIGLGHYMHGRVCRSTPELTPLVRTEGQLTYFFSADWRDPDLAESAMSWVNSSWKAMTRFSSRGTYINYLSLDDDSAVRASYGKSYQRLAALKRKYDPTNFFHLNRNIRPAAE